MKRSYALIAVLDLRGRWSHPGRKMIIPAAGLNGQKIATDHEAVAIYPGLYFNLDQARSINYH